MFSEHSVDEVDCAGIQHMPAETQDAVQNTHDPVKAINSRTSDQQFRPQESSFDDIVERNMNVNEDNAEECDKDDSIKDYLSEDMSIYSNFQYSQQPPSLDDFDCNENDSLDMPDICIDTESSSKNIDDISRRQFSMEDDNTDVDITDEHEDVIEACYQTIHTMTHCVARAISEERKDNIRNSANHLISKDLSDDLVERPSLDANSDEIVSNVSTAGQTMLSDKTEDTCIKSETVKDDQVDNNIEKLFETGDEDLSNKSYKVLAIWNEILNNTNEASSEVLYDLMGDRLKHDRGKQKHDRGKQNDAISDSDTKTSNIDSSRNASVNMNNSVSVQAKSIQTSGMEISMSTEDKSIQNVEEYSKQCESVEESIQTDQELDNVRNDNKYQTETVSRNLRQSSSESNSSQHTRRSSGTQTEDKIKLKDAAVDFDKSVSVEPTDDGLSSNRNNNIIVSACQSDNSKQTTLVNKEVTFSENRNTETVAKVINKQSDISVHKTKVIEEKSSEPVVIDLDAPESNPVSTNKNILKTPVKQTGRKQTSGNTAKQGKPPTPGSASKPALKIQGKQNFIDNLISKGVPIIIPDDEEDKMNGEDNFTPSPRSTAFEMKSRQYHGDMEKSRTIQVNPRQGYSPYIPQVDSQMSPQSLQQRYLQQYSQQQQYQYQAQQEHGPQQAVSQSYYSPQQTPPKARQQLFTPPKNVATSPRVSSTSSPGRGHPLLPREYHHSPLHDTAPPLQQFSPAHTQKKPVGSPYFKQSYTTPPKQQQNIRANLQARTNANQMENKMQNLKSQLQQQVRYSLVAESSNRSTIVIEDGPATTVPATTVTQVKAAQSKVLQQRLQQKTPTSTKPVNPQLQQTIKQLLAQTVHTHIQSTSIQQPLTQQVQKSDPNYNRPQQLMQQQRELRLLQQMQNSVPAYNKQQALMQQQLVQLSDPNKNNTGQSLQQSQQQFVNRPNSPQSSSMLLPVIAAVTSMAHTLVKDEKDTGEDVPQMQIPDQQLASSFLLHGDLPDIRQSNERTQVKRTRSDDILTSPTNTTSEPLIKRRHTSADARSKTQLSMTTTVENEPKLNSPLPEPSYMDEPLSPIRPKVEIDVDDVPDVLAEPTVKSPSPMDIPHEVPVKKKRGRPKIAMSPQHGMPDLDAFSPPISPSTRRLHSKPGKRSRAAAAAKSIPSASTSDCTSETPNPIQSMKKFGCGDCGKSYTTKAALNQHFKKHTQDRPFECDVCGKHYSQKGYLKKHILTHFDVVDK